MKSLSVMIKLASSGCNLRCKYCFYADVSRQRGQCSYGIMTKETTDRMIDHIFGCLSDGDRISIAFQGGEPTLAGLSFFRYFVETSKRKKGNVQLCFSLQTNGTLLDNAWCAFLKEHNFLVGLSLDGPAAYHDANRVDPSGKGTFHRVLAAKNLLDKYGVSYNVLTVLTNSLSRHPVQLWNFIQQHNLRYIQLIPCLGELDGTAGHYVLTPDRFATFYCQLFRAWVSEFQRGNYYSVKLFDDLVNLLVNGAQNACGLCGECVPQIVVEADGSVYPCDFYVLDEYKVGNLTEQPLLELLHTPVTEKFRNRKHVQPTLCRSCPYVRICGGGCKRMQREVCCGANDKECGYRVFLDTCLPELMEIANQERRMRMRYRR